MMARIPMFVMMLVRTCCLCLGMPLPVQMEGEATVLHVRTRCMTLDTLYDHDLVEMLKVYD